MLTDLYIRDFAIIRELNLTFSSGMTVITGETGAGKSIILSALTLVLGARCQHDVIQAGKTDCEITACFAIDQLPQAQTWLIQESLASEGECIIRRIITREGRGKQTINGTPVTQQQLRTLSHLLIHMHGQQEHHALLKKDHQRHLVDTYGQLDRELHQLQTAYQTWHETHQTLTHLKSKGTDKEYRLSILAYQVKELAHLNPQPQEVTALQQEQKKLLNSQRVQEVGTEVLQSLGEADPSILSLCYKIQQLLKPFNFDSLTSAKNLLKEATIQLEEACEELEDFFNAGTQSPLRLQEIEQRLNALYDCARKHNTTPEDLPEIHQRLIEEQTLLDNYQQQVENLEKQEAQQRQHYDQIATTLSEARQQTADTLSKAITEAMQPLGMAGGIFQIQCTSHPDKNPTLQGKDDILFLVSTNIDQPLQPLHQVASGGELSRISLAMQIITAQEISKPTLIFDEVDTGIGGTTAALVGKLLRKLGAQQQLLCITHLPQVAAMGHQHYQVTKEREQNTTLNRISILSPEERVQELARMLGGVKITQNTLAHAQEMLAENQ